MEPVRLDPSDPLASVLAWLAALARALGIDTPATPQKIRLNHASARTVRGWLAAWSRQLKVLVRAQAARLAPSLVANLPVGVRRRPTPGRSERKTARRASSVIRAARADPADLLDAAQQQAIDRRTRAVLIALRDPSAAIRRLALRLARRLARADATRAALRRAGLPPRVVGIAPREPALEPELRPPDARVRAFGPAARPAASAAAAKALA